MTYTDPTPATADDNSPAALLAQIRRDYAATADMERRLKDEYATEKTNYERAVAQWKKASVELRAAIAAAKAMHAEWGSMLPRGDTARGNGTQ